MSQKILITGSSGFIGYHLANALLKRGERVIGYDDENDYYDPCLKVTRRNILETYKNFTFHKGDIVSLETLIEVFEKHKPDKVVHLAAQAGVRYSIQNPFCYIQSNIVGFHNAIELARRFEVQNFVYASSSSVYGKNTEIPFSYSQKVDTPISLYAATKKSNELIAHSYSHIFGLPTTGLRFFTVYGPYWRPDMAIALFVKNITNGLPIRLFNHGDMKRDFTYIDDIIDGIIRAIDIGHQYEIFNLGNQNTVGIEDVIHVIEKNLKKEAIKEYVSMQPGDVYETYADIEHTKVLLSWDPKVKIEDGIRETVDWYNKYGKLGNF